MTHVRENELNKKEENIACDFEWLTVAFNSAFLNIHKVVYLERYLVDA